jgi:hypothetical protein
MGNWIEVVAGVIVASIGVALIAFRASVTKVNVAAQRAAWGRFGDYIARHGGQPVWTGVVGGAFILIGAANIVLGILRLVGVLYPVS